MKNYDIIVSWTVSGIVYVTASDLNEAIVKAQEAPLPPHGDWEFLPDSFRVDGIHKITGGDLTEEEQEIIDQGSLL